MLYSALAIGSMCLFGYATNKIIQNKGYEENWFWWGFFFGMIAVIIALSKPDNRKWSSESGAPNYSSGASSANAWRCTCGRENAMFVSTCSCGKSKRDVQSGEVQPAAAPSVTPTPVTLNQYRAETPMRLSVAGNNGVTGGNLITCPDCGRQVSRKAVACPTCGSPIAANDPSGEVLIKICNGLAGKVYIYDLNTQATLWTGRAGEVARFTVADKTYIGITWGVGSSNDQTACVQGKERYELAWREGFATRSIVLNRVDTIHS